MTGNEKINEQDTGDVNHDDPEAATINGTGQAEAENEPTQADVEGVGEEPSELEQLQQEYDALARKAQENLELAQRTQAEMENLRKRTTRDVENAHKYALERFIGDLLPVIDSLELGMQAAESATDVSSLQEGMGLTLKKFSDSLEKFGAVVVNPVGEKFNPDKHDAVSMTEQEGVEAGTVITVLQKGYELNGRLVRPAMVVVAK
ncbi:MAG: nucleotide exchange factor GrpE [Gammaproteobacteria bacterium]